MMSFNDLYLRAVPEEHRKPQILACFDPGEITGYALFESGIDYARLLKWDQLKSWPLEQSVENFPKSLLIEPAVTQCIFESYQMYSWKEKEHHFSDIPTVQIIGCLKTLCIQNLIPYKTQTAQVAKQFVTDAKLEAWGFWKPGMRHSRDAIRHGCYHLIFGHTKP